MVVLMDPVNDPNNILRANRSREKMYMFDVAFDSKATQVSDKYVTRDERPPQGMTMDHYLPNRATF